MSTVSKLRLQRVQLGLTLDNVFVRSGRKLFPSKLSRIERAIVEPSKKDVRLLAQAFHTSVEEIAALFRGGEN